MTSVPIKFKKLHADALAPRYAHTGDYGDLAADLYAAEAAEISPGAVVAVSTGLAMEFPAGHGALVEDRSGLALKGLTTLAGVIDPGYRGEVKVVLTNLSGAPITLQKGDRIAQLRIVRRLEAVFEEATEVDETGRGSGGFGSTGS